MAQPPIPAEAGAQAQPAESQGDAPGGKISAALAQAHQALSLAAELLSAAKSPLGGQLAAMKAQLESLVDGGDEQPAPQGGGPVPMEAGAAQVRPAL